MICFMLVLKLGGRHTCLLSLHKIYYMLYVTFACRNMFHCKIQGTHLMYSGPTNLMSIRFAVFEVCVSDSLH